MFVALTDTQDAIGGDHSLHVDHFGLSVGAVSVGLPMTCTADDVYRRYLDLLRLLSRGRVTLVKAPAGDLRALAAATGADDAFVARRLAALQSG
ncbi:MAG: hypothetical protein DHS20C19_22760 [Acidimicrobiales bacterium]|nr:MAG: hypothetical protein DHS20C19_22760 [Acidimicrobiales bacterium]